tara:strand:+ start:2941 stop:6117 length:3177 start_codon:yes stop_codon:yes gene_type:complete
MSVQIEVLDYDYEQGNIKNRYGNLFTWNVNGLTRWNLATGITTTADGVAVTINSSPSASYNQINCYDIDLIDGHSYTVSYTCLSLDNAGQVPSTFYVRGVDGGTNSYRPFGSPNVTVGTRSYTFTFSKSQNNNSDRVDVRFELIDGDIADKNIRISSVTFVDNTVTPNIVNPESGAAFAKFGILDITDSFDFPLALTFQVNDVKDITSTSGDYSKTFKVPATKNNNKLLSNSFNPKITQTNIDAKKPCRIVVDGSTTVTGLIKTTGVAGFGKQAAYYNCVFYGNNLSWAKNIDEKYLHQINWGAVGENILYHKTDIMTTWDYTDSDAASPFVYPIVSYGDFNVGGQERTMQLLDYRYDRYGYSSENAVYIGWNNNNISYDNPLPQSDWRPAIFVKTTLEKIFLGLGYSISSEFMNTDMFKKLVWLLPNFKYNEPDDFYNEWSFKSEWTNGVDLETNTVAVSSTNPVAQVTDDGIAMVNKTLNEDDNDLPTNFYTGSNRSTGLVQLSAGNLNVKLDKNLKFDTTVGKTGQLIVKKMGYYTISLTGIRSKVARCLGVDGTNRGIEKIFSTINVEVQTRGQTSWNIIAKSEREHLPETVLGGTLVTDVKPSYSIYKSQPDIIIGTTDNSLWLNYNDRVRITFGIKVEETSTSSVDFNVYHFFKCTGTAEFIIDIDPTVVQYGQSYNLRDVINKDYKQIDFIKGIAHAFNLCMTTDEVKKQVVIEPFNDFYLPYKDAIDWTHKLDRSKETTDKWLEADIKRNVVFKYKSDPQDEKVKARGHQFFDGIEDEYPYREELTDSFAKGQSVFENPFFAGTYNAQDSDTQGGHATKPLFSACLWTENSSAGSSRANTDKGFDFLPRLLFYNRLNPTTSVTSKFVKVQTWQDRIEFLAARSGASGLSGKYPQATSIDRNNSSSPVLSYGNVWVGNFSFDTGDYDSNVVVKGLYDTHYKNMMEMLKSNPRIRTSYFDIKVRDIQSLNFRKLIYVDGCYYRINRIIDFFPSRNTTTKVELILWEETGVFAASAPAFGVSGLSSGWGRGLQSNNSDTTISVPANENENYSA